ncbi:MAG: ATP-binding protein [Ferruginibacter sp.]
MSNLLSNAIKYNSCPGKINIRISNRGFSISNTSDLPGIKQYLIFRTISKHNSATGNGLGLAIVKEICDTLTYKSGLKFHKFNIREA